MLNVGSRKIGWKNPCSKESFSMFLLAKVSVQCVNCFAQVQGDGVLYCLFLGFFDIPPISKVVKLTTNHLISFARF